jgi:hypothetical protein
MKESESSLGCKYPYVTYCESVAAAVRYALSRGKGVIVGSQPRAAGQGHSRDRHLRQQTTLASMIEREFGREARVSWADFSTLVNLADPNQTFDGMHLSPAANATVASALVEHVLKVAPQQ